MTHIVSRRAVLGASAAGLGAGLLPVGTARAGATSHDSDLIALRRDLHAHPETAGNEEYTAAVVAARLRAAGLAVTTGVGGHGVVGVLTGGRRGRTVAYRADMDAVPPDDRAGGTTVPAHICGHDIHTTVGVGVAQTLARRRDRLAGRVVFVFQPAEEALAGAAAMIADGVLDETRPSEIHALHCGPWPVGTFLTMPGVGLPGQDRGSVTLTGPDAAERAQRLVTDLMALGTVTRLQTREDIERLVTNMETPNGPLASFVFIGAQASGATVRFSYRCWPEERYLEVRETIRALAPAVEFPGDPFPAMISPERDTLVLRRFLRRTLGAGRVGTAYAPLPFNGEDFALFLDRIPGTFTFLGVHAPGRGIETAAPHFPTFDPDERAIGHGVRAMTAWLAERTGTRPNAGVAQTGD
jgi:metal-dependent amidase/aminoacylase/carboxypeptidase family protein